MSQNIKNKIEKEIKEAKNSDSKLMNILGIKTVTGNRKIDAKNVILIRKLA
jgi:hypothetical protein